MMMKDKYWLVPFLTIFLIFGFVPMVSAHVTLHPEESSTDAWEKYSVRVPVEKDMNTTKLELQVPDEVDLVNIMPKDGWEYDLEKDEDRKSTRLNSSHVSISYAVFCLKKKKKHNKRLMVVVTYFSFYMCVGITVIRRGYLWVYFAL